MFIDSITLNNYRAYKGVNKTSFNPNYKNIFLIAGNNGFGKTTFLTSLVWCLYGKLMADVDEKFRREISDAQGYKNFARQSLHKNLANLVDTYEISLEEKKRIIKHGYPQGLKYVKNNSQYYVEICLSDVFIPSIPCQTITIRRTYDYFLDLETIDVLIDGQTNELAKDVGHDIFINDFILSKDIAKFFFFDAEKIVNLAEVKSIEEKRRLSTAYREDLGIKKYEDIKRNLENLRLKFRKKAGSTASKSRLDKLQSRIEDLNLQITSKEEERKFIDSQILQLRIESGQLQERLIREGNAISIEELTNQRNLLITLKEKDLKLKEKLREMLDIAPFAIAGDLFTKLKEQVLAEKKVKNTAANYASINFALQSTHSEIIKNVAGLNLSNSQTQLLEQIISNAFSKNIVDSHDIETDSVKVLVEIQKRIAEAEYDDENEEIKNIRVRKEDVDNNLLQLENKARLLSEELGRLSKDYNILKKQLSEVAKLVKVSKSDQEKDIIAERLIIELSSFLLELRTRRKYSLEKRIMNGINTLMHKVDFINNIRINLIEDIIDIELIDKDDKIISKEKLSKGEQQLYATAILNALVEESGIEFPVFIDSPLQKFDSIHSHNIITKFYQL